METPVDYYEVLQISRHADEETIHRVYRMMAARYHPDNPKSGDTERFLAMRKAYEVLSDPARRAQYDRTHRPADEDALPIFELEDFTDGLEGEVNRRLGILSVLYHRRRINGSKPGISLLDLERRMALPREYLDFALWYLQSKGFVLAEQNSDFTVTVKGVDYLESVSTRNTLAKQLVSPQVTQNSETHGEPTIRRAA